MHDSIKQHATYIHTHLQHDMATHILLVIVSGLQLDQYNTSKGERYLE